MCDPRTQSRTETQTHKTSCYLTDVQVQQSTGKTSFITLFTAVTTHLSAIGDFFCLFLQTLHNGLFTHFHTTTISTNYLYFLLKYLYI